MSESQSAQSEFLDDDFTEEACPPTPRKTTAAESDDEQAEASSAQSEFDAAKAYFSISLIGTTIRYAQPFTKQLRGDTACSFPVDGSFYKKADEAQSRVLHRYFLLRVGTFCLFVFGAYLYACLYLYAFAHGRGPMQPVMSGLVPSLSPGLTLLAAIAGIGVFAVLRSAGRSIAFYNMNTIAERLSFEIFKRIDDIDTRVTEACSKSRDRVGSGDWSVRARHWILVALWNAKRSEYLDRYSTTVIWTVRTYISIMERFFLAFKIALSVVIGYLIYTDFALLGVSGVEASMQWKLVFMTLLPVQTYVVWHLFGQKPENFWTQSFRKAASQMDANYEHYAEKVAGVVENLVDEVLGKEFGQGRRDK